MKHANRWLWIGSAVCIAGILPGVAEAHFERVVTSSRRAALGGASISIAGDATASVNGPAALVDVASWSVVSTYDRPFGLSDVDEAFVAAALRVDGVGAFGLAWHYTGLRDAMAENLFTLAYARDVIRKEDASLTVGVSVDAARVSVREDAGESVTGLTGGASVLLRPFPVIGIAYAVRNVTEPEFDLIDGAGVTVLERTQAWGLSYWWHRRVSLSFERRDDTGQWKSHMGVEVDLGPNLDLRSGVGRGMAAGGVGIVWGGLTLDVGYASHEFLGSSYIVTVGYAPPAPVNPYAQNP